MNDGLISKRKPTYKIYGGLKDYLSKYDRSSPVSVSYDDLLRFSNSIPVLDKNDNDTLWVRVIYPEYEQETINESLLAIYQRLYSDGNKDVSHLMVDAIDFCTFGNTRPFRIKVRNIYNDNYAYFYVKQADASRVYGLELEHIISPHRINFLIYEDTLIEEHIAGIPGDVFAAETLPSMKEGHKRLAKEFVKFNQRCLIRLLGDMRAYNYVIVPTYDFDQIQYKVRAIDFDQQSFEGSLKVYRPQFFKDNIPYVKMVLEKLKDQSVRQYQKEERALIAKRCRSSYYRLNKLVDVMTEDDISTPQNIKRLRTDLSEYVRHKAFLDCKNMGDILRTALHYTVEKYEHVNI